MPEKGSVCVLSSWSNLSVGGQQPGTIFIEVTRVLDLLLDGLRKQVLSLEEILGMNIRR